MRLLNTTTLKLRSFIQEIPPYVILSHTWGDGEVTFDDIDQPYAENMAGYDKIRNCCKQAIRDGFEWVWIDTRCIDKRSSSELSEAINSMYKWYWRAEICYAFLADVFQDPEAHDDIDFVRLRYSRWFWRGWCLQELLAPAVVEFYGSDWTCIGTKSSEVDTISRITNIAKIYLLDRESIVKASIATKISWASRRETTRPEDMAYCLLGLVDVNMPLLYGEGDKAFFRLQLELIRKTNEHTIFAWNWGQNFFHYFIAGGATGMLAPHPAAFTDSSMIATKSDKWTLTHEVTNRGLHINLPVIKQEDGDVLALLNCMDPSGVSICVWLKNIGNGNFQRRFPDSMQLHYANPSQDQQSVQWEDLYIIVENPMEKYTRNTFHRMRIIPPSPSVFSKFQLRLMSPVGLGSGGYSRYVLGQSNRAPITLSKNAPVGLHFESAATRFFVVCGHYGPSIWIAIEDDVLASAVDGVLLEVLRRFETTKDMSVYVKDCYTKGLEDGTTVKLSAKKGLHPEHGRCWNISIQLDPPSDQRFAKG